MLACAEPGASRQHDEYSPLSLDGSAAQLVDILQLIIINEIYAISTMFWNSVALFFSMMRLLGPLGIELFKETKKTTSSY